jgi:predicted aspartyl protease
MNTFRLRAITFSILALSLGPAGLKAAGLPGFVLIRYNVVDNRYILPCTLNGKPLSMLIDTGAATTVIDENTFNHAVPKAEQIVPKGVPSKITANGKPLPVFLAKNLQAGAMKFGDGPVVIADLSRQNFAARHYGRELSNQGRQTSVIDGVIGLDILRTYNAVIDTSRQVIYFNHDRSKRGGILGDHMGSFGFTKVRMKYNGGGQVEVPITLQGQSSTMVVDTGAFLTSVAYKTAQAAHLAFRPSLLGSTMGINGTATSRIFVIEPDEFKVGDFRFGRLAMSSQQFERGGPGFLGPDLMEKGHAFLDFGSLSMFLK